MPIFISDFDDLEGIQVIRFLARAGGRVDNLITTKIFKAEKAPTLPYVVDRLYSMDQEYEEFVNNPVNKREKKKAVAFASMLRKQLKTRVWDRQEDQLLRQLLEFLHIRCPPQASW